MGLFSFFKNKPPETTEYLREDDYCQVEVIPAANLDFVKKQAIEVNDFAAKHFTGVGFTAMYETENIPYPTSQLLVPIEDFEFILTKNTFSRIKKIYYESEGLINYAKGLTRAYGENNFSIWAEVKERVIMNIWVNSRGANSDDRMVEITTMLNTLGEKYQLILAAWNSCEVIDLREIEEITVYLKERY